MEGCFGNHRAESWYNEGDPASSDLFTVVRGDVTRPEKLEQKTVATLFCWTEGPRASSPFVSLASWTLLDGIVLVPCASCLWREKREESVWERAGLRPSVCCISACFFNFWGCLRPSALGPWLVRHFISTCEPRRWGSGRDGEGVGVQKASPNFSVDTWEKQGPNGPKEFPKSLNYWMTEARSSPCLGSLLPSGSVTRPKKLDFSKLPRS